MGELAVFRRARDSRDAIPPQLLAKGLVRELKLRLSDSRVVDPAASTRAYVVPGAAVICAFLGDRAGGGCWPTGTVQSGNATDTALCSTQLPLHTIKTVGLVPDGVASVTLTGRYGSSHRAIVRENVFAARMSSADPPTQVSWVLAGRLQRHPSGIPPNAMHMTCAGPPPAGYRRHRPPARQR
jgi:hypothetical protein